MRVGFDLFPVHDRGPRGGSEDSLPPPGVPRVARELVGALQRRGVLDVVRLEPPPNTSSGSWRRSHLPRLAKRERLDGIHSFTSGFAVRGPGKRVQTIHELPWLHGVRENADLAHRLWARVGPLFADRVVTATEHVAADLRKGPWPGRSKLTVVPWGVGAEFDPEPPPGVLDEVHLGHYRLPEDPLVLCLGAVRAKKNLSAVLAGVAEVKRRGGPKLHVVVSGPETQDLRRDLGLAAQLGLSANVSTLPTIEEEHLPGLLRLAAVVPVLSHSEGFGLVALEALACGTPVLVPPKTAQAEVAGAAGFTVESSDATSVADGLERAVREREELRYSLPERAGEFTWERAAERVEALWRELLT